jgi:hypothetical protein
MLEVAVAFEHRVEIVGRLGHAVFEFVHLVLDLLEASEGCERRFMDGHARLEIDVLFEQAEFESTRTHYVAAVGRLFAANQAKQGGLARAVAPDEADMLARVDLERHAAQHILRAVRLIDIRETKQHRDSVE